MFKRNYIMGTLLAHIHLILLVGCASTYILSPHYKPRESPRILLPSGQKLTLLLPSVAGNQDKLWYRIGEYSWFLEKEPTLIVHEALVEEIKQMGISVTCNPSLAQGRLEAQIRWFGPYGHNYLTAAIIVSLRLYPPDAVKPLWCGKLQAGAQTHVTTLTVGGKTPFVEEVVSEALTKAITQLRWKPGFAHAITLLATGQGIFGQKR